MGLLNASPQMPQQQVMPGRPNLGMGPWNGGQHPMGGWLQPGQMPLNPGMGGPIQGQGFPGAMPQPSVGMGIVQTVPGMQPHGFAPQQGGFQPQVMPQGQHMMQGGGIRLSPNSTPYRF